MEGGRRLTRQREPEPSERIRDLQTPTLKQSSTLSLKRDVAGLTGVAGSEGGQTADCPTNTGKPSGVPLRCMTHYPLP